VVTVVMNTSKLIALLVAVAVPVAASLYALAHAPVGSPLLVVVAFGCGLMWSGLRAYTGELVAPLTAHLVWDVCVLIVRPLG
jgi:membrane protease YdiL (CAAX protease family)